MSMGQSQAHAVPDGLAPHVAEGVPPPPQHPSTRRRSRTNSLHARPVCIYGTKCNRRNPSHFEEETHPADKDYLECCAAEARTPEFVTIRKLFEYCDSGGTGKASKEDVGKVWDSLQELGKGIRSLEDVWEKLDHDGNGFINFSEFAEFTTSYGVDLPLGLDDVLYHSRSGSYEEVHLRCGVPECQCRRYSVRRPRCRYGAACYQRSREHRERYLHPDDQCWEETSTRMDIKMCLCGHKQKLHASPLVGSRAVTYPGYWESEIHGDQEFNKRYEVASEMVSLFQMLVERTYCDVTTRDRFAHCKTWKVPRGFHVESVRRNENSQLWRKYKIKKGELMLERSQISPDESVHETQSQASIAMPEFGDYSDILSTKIWGELLAQKGEQFGVTMEDVPAREINEWILFHGTSTSASENICGHDFTMRLAGKTTGTLYGRGTYLAESFTKADEYSKEDDSGFFSVLLCRVLGGRVRYCDEKTPDAKALTEDCTKGCYDTILGDRIKTSKTYREFVVFDTENVYPEYVITYKRGEFFKSPSHP